MNATDDAYNKFLGKNPELDGKAGTLMGNWQEERILREVSCSLTVQHSFRTTLVVNL